MTDGAAKQRLDKWLWQCRFFKSRSLAAGVVSAGKVRIDGAPVSKPSRSVSLGNVLTFPQSNRVRVVKVLDLPDRRGPAAEAQACYEDLSPAPPKRDVAAPIAEPGGRPTKRDRRRMLGALE